MICQELVWRCPPPVIYFSPSVCLSICPSFSALPLLRFYQTRNKHNWCAGLASICCARSENVCVCVCMLLFRAFLLTFTHCCRRQTHTSSHTHSLSLCLSLFPSAYTLALLITHTHVDVCSATGRRDRVHSVWEVKQKLRNNECSFHSCDKWQSQFLLIILLIIIITVTSAINNH